jgi:dihydrodipicolinate synthase/N-acetylneuraminate lyase
MVVPPYYDALTFDEIKAYYAEVAGAISIPVMLYHIPAVTGQHLTTAQLGELAEIPGIAAVKDSSGNASALSELLAGYGDRLQVCNGWDTLTFFGLAAGAKACVWGAANIFPELAVELYQAIAQDSDLARGRAIWARILPVLSFLEEEAYVVRVKAACKLAGVQVGDPRSPFRALGGDELATLAALLQQGDIGR